LLADRLERLKDRFVGINPKFVDSISDGLNVSVRYAKLLDYIQYNNPPFNQHKIEDELGIPQPSISRTLTKIRNEGDTRIRQDIDMNKLALKTLFIFYEGILLPVIPAVDWISSGWWTSNGTLLIYRVPPEYKDKLLNMITEKLGEPSEVVGVKSMFIAKPSIEHYLVKTEKLDPITAIEALEKHPPIPSKMIEFPDTEITLRYKDPKALELLSYLEYDVVEARKIYAERWGFKMYNLMINRVSRILRGARVMFLDKENALIFAKIESSRACSEHIAKTLAIYPYVTNIALTDEDNLIAIFTMPFNYWNNIMTWLLDLCGSRTIRFKTYIAVLSGSLIRQTIPWRNYNNDTHYWGFDDVAKLELVRLVRRAKSTTEAFKLYEWDVNEYTRRLIETMGVDYVINLIPQLPLDVRKAVIGALNSLLQGGQSGGGGGGNP
jgi:DNA-binding Lrp family transcriptional regulator